MPVDPAEVIEAGVAGGNRARAEGFGDEGAGQADDAAIGIEFIVEERFQPDGAGGFG